LLAKCEKCGKIIAEPKELIGIRNKRDEKMVRIPTAEHFRRKVEEMVEKYGITDCILKSCIEEFSRLRLRELKEIHSIRLIRPLLLTWGQMQRWLGNVGVEKVFQKLKEQAFAVEIEPLRRSSLKLLKLESSKGLIVGLFNELMQTEFKSKSGSVKHVNSTATSKVLHLCCPDLFVMWDAKIRDGYHKFNGDGEDYFQFLIDVKNVWNTLEDTIKELQKKYGLRPTRIIDLYNWAEYAGSNES